MKVAFSFAIVTFFFASAVSNARSAEPTINRIDTTIDRLIENGSVAGAQVAVGEADSPLVLKNFGVRNVTGREPVKYPARLSPGAHLSP